MTIFLSCHFGPGNVQPRVHKQEAAALFFTVHVRFWYCAYKSTTGKQFRRFI